MIGLYRVDGDSMSPSLLPGDYVITWSASASRIKIGQVVVVNHPRLGRIIKRVNQVTDQGQLMLSGDNKLASTSTEDIGQVSAKHLIGLVKFHIRQPGRHRDKA